MEKHKCLIFSLILMIFFLPIIVVFPFYIAFELGIVVLLLLNVMFFELRFLLKIFHRMLGLKQRNTTSF
jgi:hypothetical protein